MKKVFILLLGPILISGICSCSKEDTSAHTPTTAAKQRTDKEKVALLQKFETAHKVFLENPKKSTYEDEPAEDAYWVIEAYLNYMESEQVDSGFTDIEYVDTLFWVDSYRDTEGQLWFNGYDLHNKTIEARSLINTYTEGTSYVFGVADVEIGDELPNSTALRLTFVVGIPGAPINPDVLLNEGWKATTHDAWKGGTCPTFTAGSAYQDAATRIADIIMANLNWGIHYPPGYIKVDATEIRIGAQTMLTHGPVTGINYGCGQIWGTPNREMPCPGMPNLLLGPSVCISGQELRDYYDTYWNILFDETPIDEPSYPIFYDSWGHYYMYNDPACPNNTCIGHAHQLKMIYAQKLEYPPAD